MTKKDILKKYKMTEQEFYKKFPTQEAFQKFEMGGNLNNSVPIETSNSTQYAPDADFFNSPDSPASASNFSVATGGPRTITQKPAITVSDPNDPRLKSYQDSLSLNQGYFKDVNKLKAELAEDGRVLNRTGSTPLNRWGNRSMYDSMAIKPSSMVEFEADDIPYSWSFPYYVPPVQPYNLKPKAEVNTTPQKPVEARVKRNFDKMPILPFRGTEVSKNQLEPNLQAIEVPQMKTSNIKDSNVYTASKMLGKLGKSTGYTNKGMNQGREENTEFKMGGSLFPKQKFQTGGTISPELIAPIVSGLSGLGKGQQAPQQAGSDPNAPVKKNTGKTIGGVVGGIAGAALAPFTGGISTVVGPALGSAIGGGIDNSQYKNKTEDYNAVKASQQNAMNSNIAGNFNPNAQGKTFKMGGNFTEYHGNTHENGGIPIGQSEVEGGETNNNGYIYSDTLKLGKKTFADMSKKINNKYSRRPDDKISMESKERELGNLAKIQESTGLTNNSRGMFQYGGNWMKNINNLTNQANDFSNYRPNNYAPNATSGPLETPSQQNSGFYTTDDIDSNKKAVGNIANTVITQPTDKAVIQEALENERSRVGLQTTSPTLSKSSTPSTPLKPSDTNKPLQTKVNPLGYLASAIGPAYDVARGLKGGDPVNFDRMNTKYQYADPRGAMAAANKGITSAYNSVKNAARNTTTSAGEYLANMGNLTSKEGMERAATMAGIKNQYDAANTQGLNQTNLTKDQYNAQIQMRESEARQQEEDAARSAVSQGLHNFGQNSLRYSQDRAMNKSQNMMTPFMADRFDLVEDAEGNISFKRKAIKKSDSKKDITTAPDSK